MCPSVEGGFPIPDILTTREDTARVVYVNVVHVTSVFQDLTMNMEI